MKKLPKTITDFCTLLFAATATASFSDYTKLHIIISSLLISILGILILRLINFKSLSPIFYCGVFIGMSTYQTDLRYLGLLLASAIGAILVQLTKNIFIGYGGKLGTIAFFSSLLPYLFL